MVRIILLSGLGLALAALPLGCKGKPTEVVRYDVQEEILGEFSNAVGKPVFSPDGLHWAYVRKTESGRQCVVMKGRVSKDYIEVDSLCISPNGERYAFIAVEGNKQLAVVDDKVIGEYYTVDLYHPFTIDGTRFLFRASKNRSLDSWVAVVDGKEGPVHDMVTGEVFSADGRHYAYICEKAGKWCVVIDGKLGREYDEIAPLGRLLITANGKRVLYKAKKGRKWVLVDNEREGPEFDDIREPVLNKSGTRSAYIGIDAGRYCAVVDGNPGAKHDHVQNLEFSPDGTRLAFVAIDGGKWFVVLDGKPGRTYDGVGPPFFSANGQHVAHMARNGSKCLVVVDGLGSSEKDYLIGAIAVSNNGYRVAYRAWWDGGMEDARHFLVVNDRPGPSFDEIISFGFSHDSERVVYVAKKGTKQIVSIDGSQSYGYDRVTMPVFSHDSKHVAYVATTNEKAALHVDSQTGPEYDTIVNNGVFAEVPRFQPDGSIEYVAIRNDSIYRVRHVPVYRQ